MEMTAKQRILGAIKGEPVDRVPWCPFLAYYFENQPVHIQNRGQVSLMKEFGADPMLRGVTCMAERKFRKTKVTESQSGDTRVTMYETPVGKLKTVYTFSQASNSWFITGHAAKSCEDFKVLTFLFDDMIIVESYQEYKQQAHEYKEDALVVPILTPEAKTAFQSFVEHWAGTEELIYALEDYPDTVEEAMDALRRASSKAVDISAKSDAEAFIFWDDSSTQNYSPGLFRKYICPEIKSWSEKLHRNDKLLFHHACGHVKDILPDMVLNGVDAVESISPFPTGNVTIEQAVAIIPEDIALIGGLEPTFLRLCSPDELRETVRNIISLNRGKRYVLANSDSCPPDVPDWVFTEISKLVREDILI